ncbi:MAG: hypothetical protein QM754_18655 [Tepidisphaeraceae bacterium]
MPARKRIPSLRLHKPSGQAVVTLNGKDYYLGRHGTPEAQAAYESRIGEYLLAGRIVPAGGEADPTDIRELCTDF